MPGPLAMQLSLRGLPANPDSDHNPSYNLLIVDDSALNRKVKYRVVTYTLSVVGVDCHRCDFDRGYLVVQCRYSCGWCISLLVLLSLIPQTVAIHRINRPHLPRSTSSSKQMLSKLLRSHGHRVEEADDGVKAVEMVRSKLSVHQLRGVGRTRSRGGSALDLMGMVVSSVRQPMRVSSRRGLSMLSGLTGGGVASPPAQSDSRRLQVEDRSRSRGVADAEQRQGPGSALGSVRSLGDGQREGSGQGWGHGSHRSGLGSGSGLVVGRGRGSDVGSSQGVEGMPYDAILMDFVMVCSGHSLLLISCAHSPFIHQLANPPLPHQSLITPRISPLTRASHPSPTWTVPRPPKSCA